MSRPDRGTLLYHYWHRSYILRYNRSLPHYISRGPVVSNGPVLIEPFPLNSTIGLPAEYAGETLTSSDVSAEDRGCLNCVVITASYTPHPAASTLIARVLCGPE
jgi:hypothetical protein